MALISERVVWVAAGCEIAADRQRTWIAVAGVVKSGRVVVELLAPVHGTDAAGPIEKVWADRELQWIAVDPRSPSSTLVESLQGQSMPVKLADTIAVAAAHGKFLDLLYADRLRVRGHPALDEAVRAAESRRLAGSTAVDRYAPAADQAPLMAAELAVWALGDPAEAEGAEPGVWVV